jgi:hypothetical protein
VKAWLTAFEEARNYAYPCSVWSLLCATDRDPRVFPGHIENPNGNQENQEAQAT